MQIRLYCTYTLMAWMWMGCIPSPYQYTTPAAQKDGLDTSSLQSVDMTPKPLIEMMDAVRKNQYTNIHSVLIVRRGKLVLEEYSHGYQSTDTHDMRSTTKSITALLVGLAIQKGWIKDEHQPIYTYFSDVPEVQNWSAQKKRITIRHLLTMSSGLNCNDHDQRSQGQEDKMYKTHNWIQFVLKLSSLRPPGQNYAYCTGGVVLLGAILQKASGLTIPKLAQHYLFEHLGIRDVRWSFMGSGQTDTGGHLYIRPRAMAKLGQLVLQKGRWKNKQIISKTWIQKIYTSQIQEPKRGIDYSYLWWRKKIRNTQKKITMDLLHTSGNGGQYIFIVPQLSLVMVFTGGNYNSPRARQPYQMMHFIFRSISELKP